MSKQAKDFLEAMFEKADIINFRLINNGKTINKWWLLDEIQYDFLTQKNKEGWNIYFGANPRKEKGIEFPSKDATDEEKTRGKGDDSVEICRSVFVDFDHKAFKGITFEEFTTHIKTLTKEFPPLWLIMTGHGYHCWWVVKHPLKPDKWVTVQERLIATLGTDGTIKNPERIMRCPGFLNTKSPPFVECTIANCSPKIYDLEDIELCLVNGGAAKKESPEIKSPDLD